LGNKYIEAGFLADAADTYRKVLSIDPLYESAHRGLMQAFALQGSRSQALHQYKHCAEILYKELNVKPSAETIKLYEEIRNDKIRPVRTAYSRPLLSIPKLKPLIGRQNEIKTISKILENLSDGKGGVLIIEGTAGIGKTRLTQEIVHLSQKSGFQAMIGSAHEQEKELPYSPVIEALRMAVNSFREFAHFIPVELAVAIPEIKPISQQIVVSDKLSAQGYLFAGVLRFLKAISLKTPVVMILDDLHIADDGTLKLFHYLARHTSEFPLFLIGATRPFENKMSSSLIGLLQGLEREALGNKLELRLLSKKEHFELLLQSLGRGEVDTKLANEIFTLTEGSPLFAIEIIEQLVKAGEISLSNGMWNKRTDTLGKIYLPPSLKILLVQKWNSLSMNAQLLLNIVSVAGEHTHLKILENILKIPTEEFLSTLDEIISVGLLKESGLTYNFVHPLFREAIYQQMSSARKLDIHKQIAKSLEVLFENESSLPIESIAYHYSQAGEINLAMDYLIKAGNRAEKLYAHNDALESYREAIKLLSDSKKETSKLKIELYERIGDVYRAIGDIENSLPAYKEALKILNQTELQSKEKLIGNLHRKIALGAILTVDMKTAETHLSKAYQLLKDDKLEEARVLIVQALFQWHLNQLEKAVSLANGALELAEGVGAEVEVSQACEMLALSYMPLGKWEEGLRYELRRETSGWSPDIVVVTDGHLCLWEYHLGGNEPYEQASDFISKVSEQANKLGDLRCVAVCHYALGSIAFMRGSFDEAKGNLEKARNLQQKIKSPAGESYTLARQAYLLTSIGELNQAWELIQDGMEIAKNAAVKDHCFQRLYAVALYNRIKAKDVKRAKQIVMDIHDLEEKVNLCPSCSTLLLLNAGLFYLNSKNINKAWIYAKKARKFVDITHSLPNEAQLLKLEGQIYTAEKKIQKAKDGFSKAVDIFRTLGQKYDLAETLLLWSGILKGSDSKIKLQRNALMKEAKDILNQVTSI
jgi:tetratricopeptide (TPR) repeat protein